MTGSSKLEILCGECGEENSFETTSPVVCQKCQKSLSDQGVYFRFAPWMAAILVSAGVGGTVVVNSFTEANRYPFLDEHSIVEECMNNSDAQLSEFQWLLKRTHCACALKKNQDDFDLEDWKEGKNRFWQSFAKNVQTCRGDKKDSK